MCTYAMVNKINYRVRMAILLFTCASIVSTILLLGILTSGDGKPDLSSIKQEWGHVNVREHAHMFWWLYYTTADVFNYTERPLIIWLQGGAFSKTQCLREYDFVCFFHINILNQFSLTEPNLIYCTCYIITLKFQCDVTFSKAETPICRKVCGIVDEKFIWPRKSLPAGCMVNISNKKGGPGMPSSGYGNFVELGPLDINYKEKDYSLVQDYNVLFIDNPIGVGYSYVSDNNTEIPSNNYEIGVDLVQFLIKFMEKKKEFQKVDLYIFGESYGGKMAIEFAYQLHLEGAKGNTVKWNLKGIGLGNSYISPLDYVRNYAPLALHTGLVDKQGFTRIDELAKQIEVLINKKEYEEAADVENTMTSTLVKEMPGVDVYNIIVKSNSSTSPSFLNYVPKFTVMMNYDVKQILNISKDVEWSFLTNDVYFNLQGDLMTSVTDKVEYLLNSTDLKVMVYNGVLDFLVNTAGTRMWMDNLNWKSTVEWQHENQIPFEVDGIIEGYAKKTDNLILYIVFRAGHSVPVDNMPAFREMLRREIIVP